MTPAVASVAYDPERSLHVAHGSSGTWTFGGNGWTEYSNTSLRASCARLTYDAARKGIACIGVNEDYELELWMWKSSDWTEVPTSPLTLTGEGGPEVALYHEAKEALSGFGEGHTLSAIFAEKPDGGVIALAAMRTIRGVRRDSIAGTIGDPGSSIPTHRVLRGWRYPAHPALPPLATLTRRVTRFRRSRTKKSCASLVSPCTRFEALDANPTNRPSIVMAGRPLLLLAYCSSFLMLM